jgi:PRTRC genetic system ThiF family protein
MKIFISQPLAAAAPKQKPDGKSKAGARGWIYKPTRGSALTIDLIGCGGNGSAMAGHLARIAAALPLIPDAVEKRQVELRFWDPDIVTPANLYRQRFVSQNLGENKAACLAHMIFQSFGVPVSFSDQRYQTSLYFGRNSAADIVVSCVDSISSRRSIYKEITREISKPRYWLDLGNTDNKGQFILGQIAPEYVKKRPTLRHLFDVHPELVHREDELDQPSCSVAEALQRQDLFVNTTLAAHAANLLWSLLRHGSIEHHGGYVDLKTGAVEPIRY